MAGKHGKGYSDAYPARLEPPMVAGRVPPHDLEAEAASLSAAMLDRGAMATVLALLKPVHPYSEANGRILAAITDLASTGIPVDIVSVASWLRDRGWLTSVGGPGYLAQIADATPAVHHVRDHARTVVEKWLVRQVIATCQRIAAEGYGDVGPARDFVNRAAAALAGLAQDGFRDGRPIEVASVLKAEVDRLSRQADHPEEFGGIATRYAKLDAKLSGLHGGELLILAARPGMGKTSLALGIALNVAAPVREEAPLSVPQTGVVFFSHEMPREQLLMRLICSEARVELGRYRQAERLTGGDWGRIYQAVDFLVAAGRNLWIDDTPAQTVAAISAKVRALQTEYNVEPKWQACPTCGGVITQVEIGVRAWTCRACTPDVSVPAAVWWDQPPAQLVRERKVGLVVIDYLQLMKGREGVASREQEIGEISRGLKQMAKELGVPVLALAQLSRAVERRPDKRPLLSDLRESGSLEQDADTVIFIYVDEYYNPDTGAKGLAELLVGKQRNGSTGKVVVRFERACTRFDNLAEGDYPEWATDG